MVAITALIVAILARREQAWRQSENAHVGYVASVLVGRRARDIHLDGVAAVSATEAWVAAGGSAPVNPWGNCASDPNGRYAVSNGSNFTVSSGASVNYTSGAANPFGTYSFGDQTGYSSNVKIKWVNNSGQTVYLCGSTGTLTGVIYNDNN
jgi:hypothetical protein